MLDFAFKYNDLAEEGILPYIESLTLIDRLSGTASEMTVSLLDTDLRFSSGQWRATKGDCISCGFAGVKAEEYSIDRVASQNTPAVVTWHATARPRTTKAPKNRGNGYPPPPEGALVDSRRSWKTLYNKTLREICKLVCDECGLKLNYLPKRDNIIACVSRHKETGFELIARHCRRYGLAVRATASEVVIMAAARSVARDVESTPLPDVIEVSPSEIISIAQNSSMLPSMVASARLDPRSGETIRESYGDGDAAPDDLPFDALSPMAIYAERIGSVGTAQVVPNSKFCAGSRLRINSYVYSVKEMRYSRSGDNETMSLVLDSEEAMK